MKTEDVVIGTIIGLAGGIFAIAAVATIAIINGWALSVLWGWFMVPVFGVPDIRIPHAIGLALIAAMLTHQYMPPAPKDKPAKFPYEHTTYTLARPFCLVLTGWVVKSWFL